MSAGEPPAAGTPEARAVEYRIRSLERERSALLAILLVVVALSVVDRIGQRVYAIAVWDSTRDEFVERAYLAQEAQAEEVLATLMDNARRRHPFYKDAKAEFEEARPGFQEPVTVRRVRRVIPLPPLSADGADMPVRRAVEALSGVLHVQVNAVSLYDDEKDRPLVALPSEAMVAEAQETRLENVARRVSDQLKAPDYLVEKPVFLQKVSTKPVVWPVADVLTVQQAVEYLAHGEAPALHVVQAGEERAVQKIAAKYNAKVADLAKWNPGRDLTLLRPGDKLVVRRPEPPLTVLTVERRTFRMSQGGKRYKVTAEIRRHDGEEKVKTVVQRDVLG